MAHPAGRFGMRGPFAGYLDRHGSDHAVDPTPVRRTARTLWEDTMLGFILGLLLIGIIAGFIARAVVPGRDPMSLAGTLVLGIVGSFVGGFLGALLFSKDLDTEGWFQASGIIGSILGAIVVLLIYRAVTRRRGGVGSGRSHYVR